MTQVAFVNARRRFLCSLTLALLMGGPIGTTSAAEPDRPATFAFLGELVSIRLLPEEPCPLSPDGKTRVACIQMDDIYQARYRVLTPLRGDYSAPEITFTVADHYGFPTFARYRHALLVVILYEDGPHLSKYQGYAVHRTADGQWAFCGDPSSPDAGQPALADVKPLRFAADAGIVADRSEQDVREQFPLADYDIEDGHIRCKRGLLLDDLQRYVSQKVAAHEKKGQVH